MTIDWWTLGIQTVNVLVLVWLLQRFFWRPVAAMIAQRRVAAQQALSDAQAKQAQASSALADIAKTREGFAGERDAILKAAVAAAEAERLHRLQEAEQAAQALRSEAEAAIEKARLAASQAWTTRAGDIALAIAQRLAGRLSGPAVTACFLDWLVKSVEALPDATRAAMANGSVALEAISAAPLDAATQEQIRSRIGAALGLPGGHALALAFSTDASLIAGIELRGPHLVVRNSWQADLAQIREELAHDG